MFGYVRPPLGLLPEEERERFRQVYCGLCQTMRRRCGFTASLFLNYDFTYLAMLLSDGRGDGCQTLRCAVHPCRGRPCRTADPALALAADESVILAYWQLRDGVADHGFWKGLRYRIASAALRRAYRRAAEARPAFDGETRAQLRRLSELEAAGCPSVDEPADTFALLLSAAAEEAESPDRRRILHQLLYHLGRWVYLVDAADDLKRDAAAGSYNPLIPRYGLQNGAMDPDSRREFALTLDASIQRVTAAYELLDSGCWSRILESTFYEGLFQVGKAVLDGTFHAKSAEKQKKRLMRTLHERSL